MDYKGLDSWDDSHNSKGSYLKIEAVASETLGSVTTATFDAVKGNSAGSGKFTGSSNWKSQTLEFSVSSQSNVTLNIIHHLVGGVRTDVAIDNLKLTVYPFATANDYDEMNQAIADVASYTLGFNVGEYAPYNHEDALNAYAQAIDIDQNANNSQVAVQALTSRMNNATWTENDYEVNAIWDGGFAHDYSGLSGNVQPYGWYRVEETYSGDGYNVRYINIPNGVTESNHGLLGKFTMMYGAQPGYTLPLDGDYYTLSFSYGGYNETGTREVKLYSGDNNATFINGATTITAKNSSAHSSADAYTAYSSIVSLPTTGDYILSFYRENTTSQNQIAIVDLVLMKTTEDEATTYYNSVKAEVEGDYDDNANGDSEKTAFKDALDADVSLYTVAELIEAAANLYTLRDAFVAATPKYDLFVAEKANAERIDASITSSVSAPTTAAEAETAFHAILVGEYNYVKDNFNADAAATYGITIDQWTGTATSGGNSDTPQTNSDEKWGTSATTYYEQGTNGWGSSAWTLNYTKIVTLPANTYVLKVAARASAGVTATLKATVGGTDITETLPNVGNTGLGITTAGVASFDDNDTFANDDSGYGWQWRYLAFTLENEGSVTLQIDASANSSYQWCSFGDVAVVSNVSTTALETAYNNFTMPTLGFENGQYAPYNNVAVLEAYAEAADILAGTSVPSTQAEVDAITSTLTSPSWTVNTADVDAIYNGTFSVANGNNPKGWTRSNNAWGQQITDLTAEANGVAAGTTTAWYYNTNGSWQYGNDGVYTMPLAANQAYELSFKYRKHGSDWQNWMKASVLNSSNQGMEAVEFAAAEDGTTFVTAKAYFTTSDAGNYILSIEQYGNAHLTDVSLVKAESATLTLNEGTTYEAPNRTYYESVTLTRTIKADKWNTFCVPFNMENSELGASAEVKELTAATQNNDNYTMTFSDASSIVAGKPYMVRVPSAVSSISLSNKTISSTITPTTAGDVTFTGVYTNDLAPRGSFIISNNTFYNVDSDVTLKAFRGYITVGSNLAKVLNFNFDDDATSIQTIDNGQQTTDNGAIYNVAGQRLNKMQKGINIVNGKKILK
jgi:hypothetical protein